MDGIKMFVVSVDEVTFQSEIDSMKKYNDKKLTLIYLFNSD